MKVPKQKTRDEEEKRFIELLAMPRAKL